MSNIDFRELEARYMNIYPDEVDVNRVDNMASFIWNIEERKKFLGLIPYMGTARFEIVTCANQYSTNRFYVNTLYAKFNGESYDCKGNTAICENVVNILSQYEKDVARKKKIADEKLADELSVALSAISKKE